MQEGNEIDKYDLNHLKLKRRPFMTLYVTLVGKYSDYSNDKCAKNDLILYKIDDDDPNILPINTAIEVG